MKALSIKLTDTLYQDLTLAAEGAATTQSHVVREAIAQYLSQQAPAHSGSCAQRAHKWIGMGEGPGDLSSNPAHLADFGR